MIVPEIERLAARRRRQRRRRPVRRCIAACAVWISLLSALPLALFVLGLFEQN